MAGGSKKSTGVEWCYFENALTDCGASGVRVNEE